MKIRIQKNDIRALSKDIGSCIEKFSSLIKDIDNETKRLTTYWDEAAADTFYKIIQNSYLVKLNEYVTVLKSYNTYLSNSVELYDKLENTFSQKKIDV